MGWSPEPTTKKEFLRSLWCKIGGLLKHGTGPVGRKSCCTGGWEGWLIIYYGVGGGKEKGRLRKYFHMLKKTHKIPEALPLSSEGCFSL